jgi:hypothetical protein
MGFLLCSFGLRRLMDWLVEAKFSGKRSVSNYRAKVRQLPLLALSLPFLLPYTYILCFPAHRFSPEDGHSMFLRNVGFYQPVHTAP